MTWLRWSYKSGRKPEVFGSICNSGKERLQSRSWSFRLDSSGKIWRFIDWHPSKTGMEGSGMCFQQSQQRPNHDKSWDRSSPAHFILVYNGYWVEMVKIPTPGKPKVEFLFNTVDFCWRGGWGNHNLMPSDEYAVDQKASWLKWYWNVQYGQTPLFKVCVRTSLWSIFEVQCQRAAWRPWTWMLWVEHRLGC